MFRRVLPLAKAFVAVTPDSPRALPAAELAAWLAQFSIPVSVQETLDQGVDTALALAGPEDVIWPADWLLAHVEEIRDMGLRIVSIHVFAENLVQSMDKLRRSRRRPG